ncbi:hypothetical protein Q3A66_16320 [Hymenobacter sp. BT770]|uniref:hypothetical protein n=1 Tax=Hymenobacter sp. BT770 TaxID=2886942 RepID=UPI001D12CD2C|nr:hypothetical protein [Hymenobacter sp. BT770]MCC3154581.1 hypothetical protein [Hymenobacter sp. BT770]MDO3416635.1 hypothetical protein [Hymenobacter sp. BT770]
MPPTITPSLAQVATACFPVPGARFSGYTFAKGTRFNCQFDVPSPHTGSVVAHFRGTGATPFEAIAAAVQLFHASAHAFPHF